MGIPDNLRSAVSRAHPPACAGADTNPTCHDLARHYGAAVLPARVRRPRDKAKVEACPRMGESGVGVQVVERWILAALRHRTLFSLAELNAAIAELLQRLNARAFRKLPRSRPSLFEQLDRPTLRPLPTERYVFAEWKQVRVNIDSHVEVCGHDYSVPHTLARRQLDVRLTAHTSARAKSRLSRSRSASGCSPTANSPNDTPDNSPTGCAAPSSEPAPACL